MRRRLPGSVRNVPGAHAPEQRARCRDGRRRPTHVNGLIVPEASRRGVRGSVRSHPIARGAAASPHIPVSRKAWSASAAVSPACRRIISSTMARSSSGKLDSTARSSSVKTRAALFGLRLALISCDSDPSVSRRRRLGHRLEPAYCAPIHVVGRGDVRAAIAFRQTRASALLSLRHHSMVDRRRHAAGNALPLGSGRFMRRECQALPHPSEIGRSPSLSRPICRLR